MEGEITILNTQSTALVQIPKPEPPHPLVALFFVAFYLEKHPSEELNPLQWMQYAAAGASFAGVKDIESYQGVIRLMSQVTDTLRQVLYALNKPYTPDRDTSVATRKRCMTLEEVITEYGITKKCRTRPWREAHPDFPIHQEGGQNCKIVVYRDELEEYLKNHKS